MTDELCPHGDLMALCLDCTVAPPKPVAKPRPIVEHRMAARSASPCANDSAHWIREGETIALIKGIGWVCEECT